MTSSAFADAKGAQPSPEQRKASAKAEKPPPKAESKRADSRSDAGVPGSLPAIESLSELAAVTEQSAVGLDPRRGRGARNVGPNPEATVTSEPKATLEPAAPPKAAPPKAMPNPQGDLNQRRQIAQGPTDDDLRAGDADPELARLREAELVLFPRPLPGLVPGWSWDLPRPVEPGLPEIIAGAPASSRAVATPQDPHTGEWLRGLAMPNLPVRLEQRVLRYVSFYRDSPSGRSIAKVWAKKSGRFTPALKAELARAGLPSDLVWLSLIESGHNPTIVSSAGATGLWQFMPDAGRAYGLVIDRWVDERLDPDRSTEAACRYLSDLFRRFGSWELAMAAYNMGYGGLSRAIRKYNTNDFWELARYEAGLPWETTLYVPKIVATAILMNNRRAFGIDGIDADPPNRYDRVLVGAGVPLAEIARLAGVPTALIQELNPQYLAGRTPPNSAPGRVRSWPVRVPPGTGATLTSALSRDLPIDDSLLSYVVRAGDSVESVAQANGTTEAQLRSMNNIQGKEVLAAGTVLLVPRGQRTSEDASQADNLVVVPPRSFRYPGRKRVFYRVLSGDSAARVAELFGVSRGDVSLWNALDEAARLHAGMVLQLFVPEGRDLSAVHHMPERKARVLVAGSAEFFDYFEGQNGKKRFVVRAKSGDTLASIGKRYGMSVGSMERVNRRSRVDPVQRGEPIVVYTERSAPTPGDQLYVHASPVTRAAPPSAAPQEEALPTMAAIAESTSQSESRARGSRVESSAR